MSGPRITSREDVDRIENALLSLVLDQEHNVFDDTEDLRAMADLARVALPTEGANALDTPEAREAVAAVVADHLSAADRAYREHDTVAVEVLHVLAPFVAAAQRAAWREGVEAAIAPAERLLRESRAAPQEQGRQEQREAAAYERGLANAVNSALALPVPAGFAAPGPDGKAAP